MQVLTPHLSLEIMSMYLNTNFDVYCDIDYVIFNY